MDGTTGLSNTIHTFCHCLLCADLSLDLMNLDLDSGELPFGLPLPLCMKQLVSLTGDRTLHIHSYMLEFSESLSVLASVPQAVSWSLSETVRRALAGMIYMVH